MILFINNGSSLSKAIAVRLKDEEMLFLCTKEAIGKLTVGHDSSGEFWVLEGKKTYLNDIKAVYCDSYNRTVLNEKSYQAFYLLSCWEAYLQYVLVKIPRKLGVLEHKHSLGNFLQLPIFYKIADKFGLAVPECFYKPGEVSKGAYYFCKTPFCRGLASFTEVEAKPLLILEKKFSVWGKVLVIARELYFFTKEPDGWLGRRLDDEVRIRILRLTKSFSVTLGKIILRYDAVFGKYVVYGMSIHLSESDMKLLPLEAIEITIGYLKGQFYDAKTYISYHRTA